MHSPEDAELEERQREMERDVEMEKIRQLLCEDLAIE
jgi:hypothetical protein